MDKSIFYTFRIGLNVSQILPMKPSEFNITLLVESYDKKIFAENFSNRYVVEMRIVFKL